MTFAVSRFRWPLSAALLLATGLLAGCGSGGYSASSSSTAPATTGATTTAATTASSSQQVTATESEYKIVLSSTSVKAGRYSIDAVNSGSIGHALTIDGPGVSNDQSGTLSPGQSQTLTVTLQKGTYELFCPLPGHKALGMDAKLTVT